MKEKFDNWNRLKQKIENKEPVQFRQGQIYFMSVGQNNGYINVSDFGKLKDKLLNLLDVTPNPKGSGHSSKEVAKR